VGTHKFFEGSKKVWQAPEKKLMANIWSVFSTFSDGACN